MGLRCLLVDDSSEFLNAAGKLLEQEGATVVGVATTGQEALRLAAELQPDVTLVDIDLGPESGFSITEQLAENGVPESSLILISTHREDEFSDLIEASPAVGFIPKSSLSLEAIERLLNAG